MGSMLIRREFSEGAIAGTVMGIVFFLLALCLYPVIVGLVKRRRRPGPDVETGPQVPGIESGARPSSTDLCKEDVELSRAVKGWRVPCASPALDEGVSLAFSAPRDGFFPPGQGASADYYYDSGLIPLEAADIPVTSSRDIAQPVDFIGDRVKRLKGQASGSTESPPHDRQLPSSGAAEICGANDLMKTPPRPQQQQQQQTRMGPQPSPPSYPAPGTVNPMDIMPASTEAEVWHRTEQQLMEYSVGRSPPAHLADEGVDCQSAVAGVWPRRDADMGVDGQLEQDDDFGNVQSAFVSPLRSVTPQLPPPAFLDEAKESVPARHCEQNMPQTNAAEAQSGSHLSYQSMTTPQEVLPFVDLSPPATLPPHDTPGELSLSSSECRSSNSPKSPTTATGGGNYVCDEPGCDQAFDQLHKLKHHQRYHSKAHKCTYPTCSRAFGTKTHLDRHINERHEQRRRFHCPVSGCMYNQAGGRAFSRRDNWRRHMASKHDMSHEQNPVIVDVR
ncbi:Zinc finger transcription factor ace1 [Ophiocordyceps camponoti-floridani]|uniref:Zinc finger transcription factor ace1 n=1 Tax=Ophiocordyceps camponoti-floridani TaxID=2030778 RepID=A0A8H4VBK1_9HYPO|nr:Zinc finger transcription factor ace1 [Ophiocordyceps camponoti-floridani]